MVQRTIVSIEPCPHCDAMSSRAVYVIADTDAAPVEVERRCENPECPSNQDS